MRLALTIVTSVLLEICCLWSAAQGQHTAAAAAPATILRVQLDSDAKAKLGAPVHARTVDPLYNASQLVLPSGTVVTGRISGLSGVSRDKRLDAISHGDFTPLHEARIEFNAIKLPNGTDFPLVAVPASQSGDVLRFQTSPAKRQSLLSQLKTDLTSRKDQAVDAVKAPGKMNRLKKMLFSQLPWHPQAIEAGTQYDVTLLQPITAPVPEIAAPTAHASNETDLSQHAPPKTDLPKTKASILHARLDGDLSSKTAKPDDPVSAVITQPLLNVQGQIEIPQGATLHGRVLRAQAARKWGKNGALRFTFNQVDLPQVGQQQVAGVPTAVDGSKSESLKLDAEGGVQPDTNKGVMLPLVLGWLAASSILDDDGGLGKIAVTSNGFGLITRAVAISTGSRLVGAAIGSAATARTIYTRFLAHGRDVTFSRNSQIEVELGPVHVLSQPAPQH